MTVVSSAAMWAAATDIRRSIERHPFLSGLLDGTLPRPAFDHYVEQDAHYLAGYAAALRACEGMADSVGSRTFWADAADDTVAIEQSLHVGYLRDRPLPGRSPHCSAYLSFLADIASGAGAAVLAAAVLPCFWIFSEVGRQCTAIDLDGHPYADWVATYRDPRFATATDRAKAIVDDLAVRSAPSVRASMQDAFRGACSYERLLFDDAWAAGLGPDAAPGDAVTACEPT